MHVKAIFVGRLLWGGKSRIAVSMVDVVESTELVLLCAGDEGFQCLYTRFVGWSWLEVCSIFACIKNPSALS